MKKVLVVSMAVLPACASVENWQREREANQTVVTEVAPGQYRTLTYREIDELNANKAREEETRRKQQAEEEAVRKRKLAELEKQDAARRDAARVRIAADEARGYKHVSFTDFILDYKTLPLGSKRAVSGFYHAFGDLEILAAMPVDSPISSVPRVVLLTNSSPRDARAKLLAYPCRPAFCPVLLLGRTTSCTIKSFGSPIRTDVCFAIEETW